MIERIARGRTDLIFPFLKEGGSATAEYDGARLIGWCAYYGDVSGMRYLLEHGETLAPLGENLGLDGAAFHGHWRLVAFLLENGADANHVSPETGETALHSALSSTRGTLVTEVLLQHGADPNRATVAGKETGAFMRDVRTRGETPLHRAAAFAEGRAIDLLIAAGAKLDARDAFGDSPLSWASWHGRGNDILRRLLFPPHWIHPENRSMEANLDGDV